MSMSEHKGNGRALLRTPQRNLKEHVKEFQIKERKLTFSNGSKQQQLVTLQAIYKNAVCLLDEKQAIKELAMAKLLALQAQHDFQLALAQCRLAKRALNAGTVYEIHVKNYSSNQLPLVITNDLPQFSGSPDQVITNAIYSRSVSKNTTDIWKTNIQYYAFVETRDVLNMPLPGQSSDGQSTYVAVDLQKADNPSTLSVTNMTWENSSIGLTDPPVHGDATLSDGSFRITTPDNYINLDSKQSRSFEPLSVLIAVGGLTAAAIYKILQAKIVDLNADFAGFKFSLKLTSDDELVDDPQSPATVAISTFKDFVLGMDQVCDLIFDAIETLNLWPQGTYTVKTNTKAKHKLINRASPLQKAYFNIGLGISSSDPNNPVVMASFINGPPNLNIDITPVTTYYVMYSHATVGTVIDTKEWGAAAKIDFTTAGGARAAYVDYQANGEWSAVSFE